MAGKRGLTFRLLKVWAVLAVVLCGTPVLGANLEEANRLYDEGKFDLAKERYTEVVQRRDWSANLFHNLGNAEYRLGAPGRAVLNYERALALDPTHPEAAANLKLVRGQIGARVSEPTWHDRAAALFAPNSLAIVGASAAWIVIFCLVAITRRRSEAAADLWLVLMLAAVVSAYAGAALWHHARDATVAVVTSKRADARLAPADRAGLAETLPAGSRVRVLSERGEWVYCALPGGGRGWVSATTVEKVRLQSS